MPRLPAPPPLEEIDTEDPGLKATQDALRALYTYLDLLRQELEKSVVDVLVTANLPAAAASQDGKLVIEDVGAGDRNLVLYGGGQRFRVDGGAPV